MRTYEQFAKLIAFLTACIVDISAFLVFMVLIVVMIATVYKVIGVDY